MEEGDEMGTLVHERLTGEDQRNPSVVKAVVEGPWAVDFRREPTPGAFRHVGIYAYRGDFLERFTKLLPTAREKERRLEQMRALDHGVRIRAARALRPGCGIDTAADYAAFVKRCRRSG
jgi:3-deoxy-manno-octulosonate cytidylyltransferase (CMP-KDO synthetase)